VTAGPGIYGFKPPPPPKGPRILPVRVRSLNSSIDIESIYTPDLPTIIRGD
jgi:hypothetical protein